MPSMASCRVRWRPAGDIMWGKETAALIFQIRYKLNAHGDMQPLRVPIRGVGVARDDEPPWP